jgi:hypothetical protein
MQDLPALYCWCKDSSVYQSVGNSKLPTPLKSIFADPSLSNVLLVLIQKPILTIHAGSCAKIASSSSVDGIAESF